MCLTIPKQVISAKKGVIILKSGRKQEKAASIIKVKRGDWILTQNNVIIKKISPRQAEEINKLLHPNGLRSSPH